jgi:hypothetical protein
MAASGAAMAAMRPLISGETADSRRKVVDLAVKIAVGGGNVQSNCTITPETAILLEDSLGRPPRRCSRTSRGPDPITFQRKV